MVLIFLGLPSSYTVSTSRWESAKPNLVDISQDLRNMVLDHAPHSDTFQKHYLNRHVTVDVWAIQCGNTPQQALIEQAASHGHSRSSRRPVTLSLEQSKALNEHPSITRLTTQLNGLPLRSKERRKLRLLIKTTKQKLFNSTKATMRNQWTSDQAVQDITRQINGEGFASASVETRIVRPMTSAQERLVNALTAPLLNPGTDVTNVKDILAQQLVRRAAAISAIVAYCQVEEPLVTKVLEARVPPPPTEFHPPASKDRTEPYYISKELKASVVVRKPGERLRRCFICVGKALTLPPNDSGIPALCRTYYNTGGVTRHFRSTHLSPLGDQEKTVCPICPDAKLKDKEHLRNHADRVHGIRTASQFSW